MLVEKVFISKKCLKSLQKLSLIEPFKKAQSYLLEGHNDLVDFKKRKPSHFGIYSFKINKQYRAFGKFSEPGILKIFHIDDHQ